MGAPKLEQNPLMDKNFLNAFIDGVVKTMSMMASTTVKPQPPKIEKVSSPKGDVAGVVGMVAGPMKGTLAISYPKAAIFQIMQNMLGEKYSELTPEVCDAVGEMTNQIYGTAKTTLNQLGYSLEMAIPTVIQGQFTISAKHDSGATLVIPFQLPDGALFYTEVTIQI